MTVCSLKDNENMSGSTGTLMRGLMELAAEWEREMNAGWVAEARAAPATAMTAENVRRVLDYRDKGNSMSEIAKLTGIWSASVHRTVATHRQEAAAYDPEAHGNEPRRRACRFHEHRSKSVASEPCSSTIADPSP